ncbi:hypothetical protein VNO77_23181 [Canavalia gladiata]|uniref:Uncharacterized protein n=1 Tax=Canavalia gladiata TaxID=3824 RepID=A0AAN9L5G1_CANGL
MPRDLLVYSYNILAKPDSFLLRSLTAISHNHNLCCQVTSYLIYSSQTPYHGKRVLVQLPDSSFELKDPILVPEQQ